MTEAQAIEALVAANAEDGGRSDYGEAGQGASNPQGDWTPENPVAADTNTPADPPADPVTPEGESQAATPEPTDAPAEVDSFTKLDPNTLPPEVQPYYKSMQADYTRKRQEEAERAKLYESLGDPEEARVAVELLQSLGTPEGALSFHQLLSQQLQSLGYTPAQADAMAVQQTASQTATDVLAQTPSYEDDPEAALKFELDQARYEVQQLREEFLAEREAAAQEQQYYALAGEIARQEAVVRTDNPHYDDSDINAVYALAPSHGGNLIAAQQQYEAIVSDRVTRLLNSKAAGAREPGTHAPSPMQHAEPAPHFATLDQAHAAAMERVKQIELQDV